MSEVLKCFSRCQFWTTVSMTWVQWIYCYIYFCYFLRKQHIWGYYVQNLYGISEPVPSAPYCLQSGWYNPAALLCLLVGWSQCNWNVGNQIELIRSLQKSSIGLFVSFSNIFLHTTQTISEHSNQDINQTTQNTVIWFDRLEVIISVNPVNPMFEI